MLWYMRRPMIRRMQRAAPRLLPERMRPRAREKYLAQERWARRYGLRVIHSMLLVLLISIGMTLIFQGFLELISQGYFAVPDSQ